jgi:hypothetical protein
MFLRKIKREIEDGISITKDALQEMHNLFPIADIPEETIYFSVKRWKDLKSLLGISKKGETLWARRSDAGIDKSYYGSELIGSREHKATEENAAERDSNPQLDHPTDYSKKTGKVPPGFAFRSTYEVPIEPIEKKYKKKNPYRPED